MMKNVVILFVLFLTLAACTEPIDIDYPEATENLVLNALISEGDTIKTTISKSQPYTVIKSPPSLDDGDLDLYENNSWVAKAYLCERELNSSFASDTSYIYCFDYVAKQNKKYTIEARTDEFEMIKGTTELAPKIEVIVNPKTSSTFIGFTIKDNPNEINYYHFQLLSSDSTFGWTDQLITMSTQDLTIEMIGFNSEVVSIPDGENIGNYAFLTDELFNGKEKNVLISLSFSGNPLNLSFRVQSCSRSYYEFLRTAYNRYTNTNDVISPPTQVFSNVSNGYGLVGSNWDTVINVSN